MVFTNFFFLKSLKHYSVTNIVKMFSEIIMQFAFSSVNCGLKKILIWKKKSIDFCRFLTAKFTKISEAIRDKIK